jgi:tripartite-type tricarboxylate transporter receptor subunit TctC
MTAARILLAQFRRKELKEQTMKRPIAGLIKRLLAILIMLDATFVMCGAGHAQEYPSRPVTIIVPYEAGGGVDRVARLVADHLQQQWKSPVIVDNRPGANGNIGADYVARSPADGYTLLYSPPGPLVINKLLYPKLNYDSDTFVPISLIVTSPNVLVVHPKVGVETVQQLIAYAKANPDRLNYGSPGNGGTPHLTAEMFKMETGTAMVHLPYKGTSTLLSSLLGGYVDLTFSELGNVLEHVRANKLRALAVASEKHNPALPDVPAMTEILPGFVSATWSGLAAPAGMPPTMAQRIYATLAQSFALSEAVQQMLQASHQEPVVSTPDAMAQQIASERTRWGAVIRATGLKGL